MELEELFKKAAYPKSDSELRETVKTILDVIEKNGFGIDDKDNGIIIAIFVKDEDGDPGLSLSNVGHISEKERVFLAKQLLTSK